MALEKENPGWNFESVKEQAQSKWKKLLSRVQVQGTPEQKTAFYTSLYHLYTQPNDITDVDGRYRGVNDSVFIQKADIIQHYHCGIPIEQHILCILY